MMSSHYVTRGALIFLTIETYESGFTEVAKALNGISFIIDIRTQVAT